MGGEELVPLNSRYQHPERIRIGDKLEPFEHARSDRETE